MSETGLVDLVHKRCGRVVLRYDHRPLAGEPLLSVHATLPDGTHPRANSMVWCFVCGCSVSTDELAVRDPNEGST